MKTTASCLSQPLIVPTAKSIYILDPNDIVRLEASGNYTFIYMSNQKRVFTAKVLKHFATALSPHGFIRTHKTHLVNPSFISKVTTTGQIMMKDESVAAVSRRMRRSLRVELNQLQKTA